MKHLFILRHAQPYPYSATGKDFDRELNEEGKQQLIQFADYLLKNQLEVPFDCFVSTAKRTQQTYSEIRKTVETMKNHQSTHFMEELYHASLPDLLRFVWNSPSNNALFIVGHNNGISELISYLTGQIIVLTTAEFIHLTLPIEQWQEASKEQAVITNRFYPI